MGDQIYPGTIWIVSVIQSIAVYLLLSFLLLKSKKGVWAKLMSNQPVSTGVVGKGFILLLVVPVWLIAAVPAMRILFMFFNWMNHLL